MPYGEGELVGDDALDPQPLEELLERLKNIEDSFSSLQAREHVLPFDSVDDVEQVDAIDERDAGTLDADEVQQAASVSINSGGDDDAGGGDDGGDLEILLLSERGDGEEEQLAIDMNVFDAAAEVADETGDEVYKLELIDR